MRIPLKYMVVATFIVLVSGCASAPSAGTGSEQAPGELLAMTISPPSVDAGSTIRISLRAQDPDRLNLWYYTGWVCFGECSGDGESTPVTFIRSSDDPQLYSADVTVPVLLTHAQSTGEDGGRTEGVYAPVMPGQLPVHACIVTKECGFQPQASGSVTIVRGVETVAWEDLPADPTAPEPTSVPRLGTMSTSARSPVPDSQRSVECVYGNFDPRMGLEPPRLLVTDDAGNPLPPVVLGSGGNPLFGRLGYADCEAVALDPVRTGTFYLTESPHAGGDGPGAYPWPQFTQDGGATWAPVPAPEGFEARRTFVGFDTASDGVTAWFSQAGMEESAEIAEGQILGSLTRDGGQTWTTVEPTCPEGLAVCLRQLRNRPPLGWNGLIRSTDGGRNWSWAALNGILFRVHDVYVVEGSAGQVLEAVYVSMDHSWSFAPLLRSEDGGVTWRYVKVPEVPGGWQEYPGHAPEIRLDSTGALLVGKGDSKSPTRWYRLERGSTQWVEVCP